MLHCIIVDSFRKVPKDNFPYEIIIEHFHNHPIDSLEAKSFKGLSEQVCEKVKNLFTLGMAPSRAYYIDELEFHVKRADRSICPRRRDFNTLYRQYCAINLAIKMGKKCSIKWRKN